MRYVLFVLPFSGYNVLKTAISKKIKPHLVVLPFSHLSECDDIVSLCEENEIEITVGKNLKNKEFIDFFKSIEPEVIISTGFDTLIPKEILDTAKIGAFNLHPSLLPKYRGGNPYFWVIKNNEKKTGITVHFMTEKFDRGDILFSETILIDEKETLGSLFFKISNLMPDVFLKLINKIKNNDLKGIPQTDLHLYQAPKPKPQDLEINWKRNAKEIECLVRAANPFLGAYTFFENQKLVVYECEIVNRNYNIDIGEYFLSENDFVYKCLDAFIKINVMQLGIKRIFSEKFLYLLTK